MPAAVTGRRRVIAAGSKSKARQRLNEIEKLTPSSRFTYIARPAFGNQVSRDNLPIRPGSGFVHSSAAARVFALRGRGGERLTACSQKNRRASPLVGRHSLLRSGPSRSRPGRDPREKRACARLSLPAPNAPAMAWENWAQNARPCRGRPHNSLPVSAVRGSRRRVPTRRMHAGKGPAAAMPGRRDSGMSAMPKRRARGMSN